MTPAGLDQLKHDEGCRLTAYADPLTGGAPWTIGYGCTGADADGNQITARTVWTQQKAQAELTRRISAIEIRLRQARPWIAALDAVRRDVLTNMAYNLGLDGLLGFRNTLADIEAGRFASAASRMLESNWAQQVGARARRLADQMRTGQ